MDIRLTEMIKRFTEDGIMDPDEVVELKTQIYEDGTVDHDELPGYLAAMDAALVLAPTGAGFHYSPLKLAEYLAAGVAVIAPAVGQLPERLTDGVDALLVPPDDPVALATALTRLRDDPALAGRIGTAGRATAETEWSWDHQVRRVLDALG